MVGEKLTKEIHILLSESQNEKMRLIRFYSSKSVGEIIRQIIDKLNPKDFNK